MTPQTQMEHRTAPAPKRLRDALLATALGASLIVPALAPLAFAQEAQGGQNLTQQTQTQTKELLPSLSPIIQKVMPAVVNISVTSKGGDMQSGEEDAQPGAFGQNDNNGQGM